MLCKRLQEPEIMLKPRLSILALILAGAGATLLCAADFWQTKKYSEWNEKEVHKILSDSPWSHPVEILLSQGSSLLPGSAGGGGRGGRGGRGGGGDSGANDPSTVMGERTVVTIRFIRALPVKQAVMRQKFGDQVLTSPDAQKDIERQEPVYIVAVLDIPVSVFGDLAADPQKLAERYKQTAQINIKGRDPIRATEARVSPMSPTRGVLLLAFPKDKPITLQDENIEVNVQLGRVELRHKIKLKDMVFDGKLEI
jgi:hypothetical protein